MRWIRSNEFGEKNKVKKRHLSMVHICNACVARIINAASFFFWLALSKSETLKVHKFHHFRN